MPDQPLSVEEIKGILADALSATLKKGDLLTISPRLQTSKEDISKLIAVLTPVFQQTENYLVILPPGMKVEHVSQEDLAKLLPTIKA
jgi:hypothetical protein